MRNDSGSPSHRSGRCSPAKQRRCLCSAAPPQGRDVGCSLDCWLRRRNCETGPPAAENMVLWFFVSMPLHSDHLFNVGTNRLTLLRRPTQHARKRRTLTPNALQARIVLLSALQPRNALRVLCLHLLETDNVGLQAPRLVVAATAVRSESLALRIHRSCAPSESPVQTLSSRLSARPLLALLRPSLSRPLL